MKCKACNVELETVDFNQKTDYQFDNALWIGFFGGYSMFVDDVPDGKRRTLEGAIEEAVICHECAHELCEANPWINKLIQPLRSHAHTSSYWENNPDHEGWDKPKK